VLLLYRSRIYFDESFNELLRNIELLLLRHIFTFFVGLVCLTYLMLWLVMTLSMFTSFWFYMMLYNCVWSSFFFTLLNICTIETAILARLSLTLSKSQLKAEIFHNWESEIDIFSVWLSLIISEAYLIWRFDIFLRFWRLNLCLRQSKWRF
jgi:hypothetical protein